MMALRCINWLKVFNDIVTCWATFLEVGWGGVFGTGGEEFAAS
jgi:hypothetical protein